MHHRRDWSHYNRQLVNRGNINFWITPEVLTSWAAKKAKKNGHPFIYGEELIKMLKIPCYTQLCRRMKTLTLPSQLLQKKHITDIVIDTTGLKYMGQANGEAKDMEAKSVGRNCILLWTHEVENWFLPKSQMSISMILIILSNPFKE